MSRFTAVRPLRPVAPYQGGKRRLGERLAAIIDQTPHVTYAEPFVGMGGVFLRRARRPKVEIINDRSADVAGLFRVLQRHYQAFVDMIRWQLATRAEFDRLQATDPTTLTDLERAARFLYLQRTTYGGKIVARTFGMKADAPSRFDVTRLTPLLEALHERLAGVTVESLDWPDFTTRFDTADTLFYLDPPYWGGERDYGPGFSPADFGRMAQLLSGLQGRFLLSINDAPEVRRIFKAFPCEEVELPYTIGPDNTKTAAELIVWGPGDWRAEIEAAGRLF